MGRPELFTVARVAEALEKANGRSAGAAELLKCGRRTIDEYVQRHPELRQAKGDAQEAELDHAESRLRQLMDSADIKAAVPATIFYLKCRGKARGWIERTEQVHSGPGGGPIALAAFPLSEQTKAAMEGRLLEECDARGVKLDDVSPEARTAALLRLCGDIAAKGEEQPAAKQDGDAA